MAIVAKFVSDFSDWKAGVQSAQKDLDKLKASTEAAGKETAKLGEDSAKSFRYAADETSNWSKDFHQFDSILSASGINVGKYVKAAGELEAATGRAAGTMSTLAAAGVAAGAALAAIEAAKLAQDFLATNQAAQDLLITLQGLTNPKFETEQAKQDTIQRAILQGMQLSGDAAQDYANAVEYLTDKQKENNLITGYSRTAYRDSLLEMVAWDKEIQRVVDRGDIKSLNADLESHNRSLEYLSTKYGVHVEALQYYQRELAKAAELEKEEARLLKEEQAAALEFAKTKAEAFATAWKDVASQDLSWLSRAATGLQTLTDKFDAMVLKQMAVKAELEAFKSSAAALGPLEQLTAEYGKLQASMAATGATAEEQELAYLKYQQAFMGVVEPMQTLGDETGKTGDATQQAGQQAAGAVAGYQALGAAVQYAAGSFQNMYTQIGHAPGYEASLRTMNDMFSEYGRAGVPVSGGLMPGAAHSSINVNIQGSVLGTVGQIQDAMMQAYRQGGNRVPA